MPQYAQTIPVPGYSHAELLSIAYGSLQQLGWHAEFAAGNRLTGYTRKTWNSYHDHLVIDTDNGSLTIESKLPDRTTFDLLKKNKKNVARFLAAFEKAKDAAPEHRQQWEAAVLQLQEHTQTVLAEEKKEAEEASLVMNLSGSRTLTYAIIGINVLVFLAMVVAGVGIFEPTVGDLAKWGGNFKPYTTSGDWWRLLTSVFVHAGLLHLAFNMYALLMIGLYLEPMLGKWRYAAAYLCAGIISSIASIWWHDKQIVSVGASGAIFGLYGVFLALLSTRLIPHKMRKSLLQSIGIFIVFNLAYGAGSKGVDNAAHIGGLLSGLLIGYLYFPTLRQPLAQRSRGVAVLVLLATLAATFLYLQRNHNDQLAYERKVDQVLRLQDKALKGISSSTIPDSLLLLELKTVTQPQWQEAKRIMSETSHYHLDTSLTRHRQLMQQYIDLWISKTDLNIRALSTHQDLRPAEDSVTAAINEKVAELERKKE